MSNDKKYPEWRDRYHRVEISYESLPPNALIQKINDVCDTLQVPREDILIEFCDDSGYLEMVYKYTTPETERERDARINFVSFQERQERELLAKLKAKYENE